MRSATGVLTARPNWLVFSHDGGTLVVSTSSDGTVTLWDARSATRLQTLRGHSAAVQQPVFSPDGAVLYTVAHDGTAIAWDVTRRLGSRAALHVHARPRAPPRIRPASRHVQPRWPGSRARDQATGDRALGCGDLETGRPRAAGDGRRGEGPRLRPRRAHARGGVREGSRNRLGCRTPIAAVCTTPGLRRLCLRREHQPRRHAPGHGRRSEGVLLWDLRTGARLGRVGDGESTPGTSHSVPMGPASPSSAGSGGRSRSGSSPGARGSATLQPLLLGIWGYALAFSPDGRTLASGGILTDVYLWDVRTRRLLRKLEQGSAGVLGLDFSPDGRLLAVAGQEPVASLWDVATGARIGPTLTAGDRRRRSTCPRMGTAFWSPTPTAAEPSGTSTRGRGRSGLAPSPIAR